MTKRSKSYEQAAALVDREKLYTPAEAVKLAKQTTTTKRFEATVEVAMRLGVDPRKADQMVRGTVSLPAGSYKGTVDSLSSTIPVTSCHTQIDSYTVLPGATSTIDFVCRP